MIVPVAESDEAAVIVVWEAAKELNEHIVNSGFTSLNLRVFRAVEHNREISAVDSTLTVGVEFVEALLDAVSACFVWLASNADYELVEVDEAVLVQVGLCKHLAHALHRGGLGVAGSLVGPPPVPRTAGEGTVGSRLEKGASR